ncbi:SpoIID/LytB domain-containing protein [Acaryochloris sp. IP29b_bin.137]|uniref:SpoIID/LytB domain-containing protein n=1 Tax=Acaryochloris sp. IP29b_bin.137 TaxID=2969217 RepID=UPI002602D954|nr:SpoIID/LytB domain-containing protein [Acaryochloris sp. IP29b_bin.137]
MICPQYKLLGLGHGPHAVLLLTISLGGLVASGCDRPATVQSLSPSKIQPVQSPAPVIPAPELTTLAPAPTTPRTDSTRPTPQPSAPVDAATPLPASAKPSSYQANPVAALALPPKPAQAAPRVPIRVAIAQQSPYLVIGSSTPATVVDQQGQAVKKLVPTSAENVIVQGGQLQIGAQSAPNVVWIKPESATGLVYVSGRWYRGAIQVIANRGKLLGVNHLDMESYLYSVVGAEMPASWPIEALKSQAIAARSYALAHIARPANPFFDLGDTQRWQAYKGVETEAHSTLAAVEATAGIVLSHEGAVVESLYAASDQIVREVHKGFGMSQNGANQLAQQQYSYQQILAHFYPGTRLAWLQFSS